MNTYEELAYIATEAMLRRNYVRKRICIELQTMHIKWANAQCSHTERKKGINKSSENK